MPSKKTSQEDGIQTVIITLAPTPIISIPEAPLRRFISSPVLCYYDIQPQGFWLIIKIVEIWRTKYGIKVLHFFNCDAIIKMLNQFNIFDIATCFLLMVKMHALFQHVVYVIWNWFSNRSYAFFVRGFMSRTFLFNPCALRLNDAFSINI